MTVETHKETLGFQAEVSQLLKLMIHSLYSNKEIFLRELISNASDACDKLRFEGLSDDALYENDPELKIRVSYDKEARTLTLSDNGIGMSRQEVIDNIGTIARSGTKEFLQRLTGDQAKDAHLIGQFGVGFYSAFIVADKVTLTTRAPFDLWDRERRHGVKLYVRRVFIMDDAEQLMPGYLRFVRGVIDSSDLPLNVSREILQASRDIEAIRAGSVKKVLDLLEGLEPEKYAAFWKEFGLVLKEGAGEDAANKERIAKLLRFASTHADTADQTVSLADYIGRMKEGQDKIYYLTAETFAAAKSSPHLEVFRKKGIEVLLLSDRVDEWVVSSLTEFDGKPLQSVAKGGLDLGSLEDEQEKEAQQKEADEFKDLLEKMQQSLGDKVKEVRVTHRLTDSASCLVADAGDLSANLERMLKAAGQKVPGSKPILEINPGHPMVKKLKAEMGQERFGDWSHILFDQALLAEGGQLEDPAAFVHRLNGLILALGA